LTAFSGIFVFSGRRKWNRGSEIRLFEWYRG